MIVTVVNKTKQGIPLLVKDGDTNRTVTVMPKGPSGFIRIELDCLTQQARRLEAQGRIEIR